MDMSMMGGMPGMEAGGLSIITVLKYVFFTLGGGALVGFVSGKIFAAIRYPNPEKRQLFSTWQKIAVLVVCLASIGLIVGAFFYKPEQPDTGMEPGISEPAGEAAGGEAGTAGGTAAAPRGEVFVGGYGGGAVMVVG